VTNAIAKQRAGKPIAADERAQFLNALSIVRPLFCMLRPVDGCYPKFVS
jgi:hypothetical protein